MSALLTKEREEHLFSQVVLTLISDRDYHEAVKNIAELNEKFERVTWDHLQRLCTYYDKLTLQEWAYVVYKMAAQYALKIHTEAAMKYITGTGWRGHLSNYLRGNPPLQPVESPAEIQPSEQSEKETTEMNQTAHTPASTIAFETKHYVFGQNVANMTEAQLIEAVKKVEAEIADLKSVMTKSSRIAAKIKELESMLAEIVKQLDGK